MALGIDDLPIKALGQGLKASFQKAYKQFDVDGVSNDLCTTVPSDTDSEAYPWLGQNPSVREFVGERQAKTLAQHSYELKNKTWESTLGVKRNDIEDNKLGQVKLRIQSLAADAVEFKEQLLIQVIEANGLCYDGQNFFDTDHPVGGGNTQSNSVSVALTAANLDAARLAIATFKDTEGKYLNLRADYLLVPPALETTAEQLLTSDYHVDDGTATGTSAIGSLKKNVLKGKMTLGVSGYITDTNSWYVFCTKKPLKPFIFQERSKIEFGSLEKDSDSGFMRDEFFYGTRQRCNIGYGMWQMAYKSAGAT